MRFDMSQAWNEAIGLLSANRDVVLIVAGVFFFLPQLALALVLPQETIAAQMGAGGDDPEAMMNALTALYASNWWVFVLIGVMQGIGMLGMLALLRHRSRPTVGEALVIGAKGFLPYFAVQILISLIILLIVMIPVAVGAGTGSVPAGVLLGIVALVAVCYVLTKFSLATPSIAIGRIMNPVAALSGSWKMTKGNSVRIFLFYTLLFLALMIVALILSMIVGVVFALMGPQAMLIGNGLVNSLINAAWVAIFVAVLAAVYRQLGGSSEEAISETFD